MATMNQAVHPRGIWLKTHFEIKGGRLHATTYLTAAGNPCILKASVDLRQVAALVSAYHKNQLHGGAISGCIGGDCAEDDEDFDVSGCVGCSEVEIGKRKRRRRRGILRVAKLKVLNQVQKKVRKALSKVIKPMLTVAAVVYPPVGIPARLAYEGAERGLRAITKGTNYASAAGKLIAHGKKVKARTVSKLAARAVTKGLFKKHGKPKVMATIQKVAKKAVQKKLSKTKASQHLRQQAADVILDGRKRREVLRKTIEHARAGSLKDQKKQAIYRLVAAHHRRLRALGMYTDQSGVSGLLIKAQGSPTISGDCIGCTALLYPAK